MNRNITEHELWNFSNEQIAELTKGRFVRIVLKDGNIKNVCIQKLLLAANPPYHFCGFLTTDNHCIDLLDINRVEL